MTKLNKALMASTAIAFACGLAMPASAQDPSAAPGVVASQKKVKLKLYGQVTRQMGFVGDGESVTFKQGENGNTGTRMGIVGSGKVTNDINLKTVLEYSVSSGANGGGTQFVNEGGSAGFSVRKLDVILSSKKFGAVWMGRGEGSTDGTSEVDLSGMASARLGGTAQYPVSSFILMDKNSSAVPQAVATVGRFFNSFDGTSRQNRIRYDTPTFFGFMASASLIDKHNVDASLNYEGKIAGTQIAGAVGYCHTKGTESSGSSACFANSYTAGTVSGIDQVNGSISVKLPIGLGATFSGGAQRQSRTAAGAATKENPYNLNPVIFYTTKMTELGSTTFDFSYEYSENVTNKGDKGNAFQVDALQRIDSIGGDYYLQFNYIDVKTATNDNIEPLWYFGGGFRQRF
jgi:hypothetical protein